MLEDGLPQRREQLLRQLSGDVAPLLAAYPLPELRGQRLFLAGATGFVGYWLLLALRELNAGGADIRVVALSRDPAAFLGHHPEYRDAEWLSWVQGDIRDYSPPPGRFDAFIHGATDTSPAAASRPLDLFDSIVSGTQRLLEHARAAEAQRVLLLSSGAVYGEQPPHLTHLRESDAATGDPTRSANAYGEGKRAMEMLAACHHEAHGIVPVIARCFAFVGYGLPRHLAIGQFIRDAQENDFIAVKGTGRQVRSYLYAADLAVWLLALLCRGRGGFPYNVGSPVGATLAEVAETVRRVVAPAKRVVIQGDASVGDRQRYVPDTSQATRELNLSVWTDLPSAIEKTALAYRLAVGR